jgi:hypothetical protein
MQYMQQSDIWLQQQDHALDKEGACTNCQHAPSHAVHQGVVDECPVLDAMRNISLLQLLH